MICLNTIRPHSNIHSAVETWFALVLQSYILDFQHWMVFLFGYYPCWKLYLWFVFCVCMRVQVLYVFCVQICFGSSPFLWGAAQFLFEAIGFNILGNLDDPCHVLKKLWVFVQGVVFLGTLPREPKSVAQTFWWGWSTLAGPKAELGCYDNSWVLCFVDGIRNRIVSFW